jgi:hypothetical protein
MPRLPQSRQSTQCFGGVALAGQDLTFQLLCAQIKAQKLVSHDQSKVVVLVESSQTHGGICKS